MAVQVASLFGVLSLKDQDFKTGLKNAKTELSGFQRFFSGAVQNVQTLGKGILVGAGAIAAGAALVSHELLGMANEAAVFQGVEEAFNGLVESTGRGSREMLRELQKQSAGMADNQALMLSYNKAAQLVSTTFANELPNAMDELAKVASATGQDMGFLMDSLVVGVGRLSPMILDNLGIQVDLTAAYEAYGATIGKTADQLSKAEQQTALMNQVMQKLETNTAAMPSVLGQTDTKVAQFEANMQNLRFTIGALVVPALDKLVTIGSSVISIFDMMITGDFKGGIFGLDEDHPVITFFLELRRGIDAIMAGVPVFDVLANLLGEVAQQAFAYDDLPLFDFLINARQMVVDFLKPIGDWISANIRLEDVLIAAGIAVGSVVIPALIGIIAAAAPIVLTIGALIGGVALLRKAWESDFLGIRTFITEQALPAITTFIQDTVLPALSEFGVFLGDVWTVAQPQLQQLLDWFTTSALPSIVDFVTGTVIPGIQDFVDILEGIWTVASVGLGQLLNWFTTSGAPAINTATEGVQGFIDDLQTTLTNIWTAVQPHVQPIVDWFQNTFSTIGERFIQPVIDFIGDIIEEARRALDLLRQIGGAPSTVAAGPSVAGFQPTFGRDFGGPGLAGVPYIIGPGQRGNEAYVPGLDGSFIPNFMNRMEAAASGGSGVNIHGGTFTIIANDPDEFGRKLQARVRKG